MPRLTANQYLKTHDRLRRMWLHDPGVFADITLNDQWLLHDFFVPDRDLSDLALLAYRDWIAEQRPSLPHQAGRALSRFWDAAAIAGLVRARRTNVPVGPRKHVRQADRQLVVKPLAHPELDGHKLARASSGWRTSVPARSKHRKTTLRPELSGRGVGHLIRRACSVRLTGRSSPEALPPPGLQRRFA
jgi:hypothetical protein